MAKYKLAFVAFDNAKEHKFQIQGGPRVHQDA